MKYAAYAAARNAVFPFRWFSETVAFRGETVSIGSGYGVLERRLALMHPEVSFTCAEFSAQRTQVAQGFLLPNVTYTCADVLAWEEVRTFDVVMAVDVLHHLPKDRQEDTIGALWRRVGQGGSLVIKDLDTRPRWKMWWAWLHDLVVAGRPINYRPVEWYRAQLTALGGVIEEHRAPTWWLPYAHVLFMVKKPITENRLK